jgi:hypothetical protein
MTPRKQHTAFMICNAGRLFVLAVGEVDGMETRLSDKEPGHREALFSIIFAAISLEAFINELGERTKFPVYSDISQQLLTFGEMLDEAEESHAQVLHKYQLAKFVLTGKMFDRTSAPYQNAATLIALRNAIVHTRGEPTHITRDGDTVEEVQSKIIQKFSGTRAIGTDEELRAWKKLPHGSGTPQGNWLDRISTKALARWSCEAASGMVIAILDALPAGEFADHTNAMYRQSFSSKW